MGVNFRGPVDPIMEGIAGAIRAYTDAHPAADADIHRYSNVSVRVRVVDPDFRGKSRAERHRIVWPLLYALDEDVLGDLTMLLLLTPEERDSPVSREFDGPPFADSYAAALKAIRESGATTP